MNVVDEKRRRVNTVLTSTSIPFGLQTFDLAFAKGEIRAQKFSIPKIVQTSGKPEHSDVKIRMPTKKSDALKFIRAIGFPGAKSGTYAGTEGGIPVLPSEGLAALSYVLDNHPEFSKDGKEFLSRALSQFGKETDYNKLTEGLKVHQISAGIILFKVCTEGLSGLSGDLYPEKGFKEALETRRDGFSDEVMVGAISAQYEVIRKFSGLMGGAK